MANYREDFANINLETGTISRNFMNHSIGGGDALGDRFGVRVFRNGEAVTLGGTCAGYFVRNTTGETVVITGGVVSGNEAYVTLPAACYAVEGSFTLAIKVTVDSEIVTLRIVDGVVDRTNTSVVVDPGDILPSIEDLLEAIEDAVESIPADYSSLWTSLAPAFSTSTAYKAGQYVTYDGKFWRFTTDHAAGAWNAAHATQVNVGGDMSDLKSALDDYVLPVIGGKKNLFDIEKMKGITGLTVVEDSTEIYGKTSSFSAVTELPVCLDGFPEKQQFRITMYAYNANASGSSLGLSFKVYYTDGTNEVIFAYSTDTSTYTRKSVLTAANKTVEKLRFSYSNGGSNIWHVKDIQIEAGTDATEYEAFEPSAIDYVARNIPSKYRSNVESAFNLMYNGINAVDYESVTDGKYADISNGKFVSSSGFAITDYIPIRHGMTMTANKHADSSSAGTCFYDIYKQFIAGYAGNSANRILIAPEGSAYVVISARSEDISSLTVYLTMDAIKQTVNQSVDNIDNAESSLFNGNNVIDTTLISASTRISSSTGASSSNQYTFATHYIPIREGMRLTMNKVIDSSGYGTAFYDINKNFIEGYPSTSSRKVLTAPKGSAFVRMTFLNGDLETATAIISAKTIDEAKAFTVINQKTKWLAMGDSITFGVYSKFTESSTTTGDFEGWVRLLASAMNYDITVMASKGMGYTASVTGQDPEGGSTRISISTLLDRAVALAGDFNLITIAYGINDYNNPSQSTLQTILAGLDEAIQKLGTAYKFARIVVITPFNSSRYGDATTNYCYNYERSNNLSLKDIADAIKERCAYYGVECVYGSNGFLLNNYNIETLLPDGVHPAKETHALIAKTMAHNLVY